MIIYANIQKTGVFYKKQSGIVLVVSLIILLLLTLIGLSGMQSTSLEEKMASNMNDKNIAFQAAEATLKEGEEFVAHTAGLNCSPDKSDDGLFSVRAEPNIDTIWTSHDVRYADVLKTPAISKKPRLYMRPMYVIQCLSNNLYRITAYAKGLTVDSVVILQSVYSLNPYP